ncbi:MAG: alpha/beta hydrolase [Anaerolineales bacterium]|nr:alpha/beta hydrolase [Anaerolineales bacterium]
MSVVILQDELVHYEVLGRGRGKPLIFLHGWVGSWRYWIPTMQAASISFRTYALDLWGFGESAKIPDYYALEHQVNLLELFLDKMGIGRIALIGHGLGAIVGMMYAERSKSLSMVDRIMTIGLPNGQHTVNPRMFTAPPEELADWLLNRSPDSEAARLEAPKADQRAIQYSLAHLQRMDISALSQNLNVPCLMIYGQNDPAIEGISVQDQSDTLPKHIHQIVFEQSGHFPMLDEASKFNRLLVDFLSLSSGISPRQLQLKEEWKRRVR